MANTAVHNGSMLDSSNEKDSGTVNLSSEATVAQDGQDQITYITGIRFWLITFSLAMSLFLTNLEIPIVTTSLLAITNDLGGFSSVSWVISSYLLGYVGVLVLFAKLSDILGRKLMLATAISIFIIFSAACGASQTIEQLIVFRAFQGIGGGGNFALATTIFTELAPPERLAQYMANMSVIYALSLLLGPIFGGSISSNVTWRWVFLINIPPAVLALACAITAIPHNFPYHGHPNREPRTLASRLGKETRNKLDFIGATLLILATLTLTAGFEEADAQFPWKSAYVIVLLTSSGLLWIAVLLWQRHLRNHPTIEPVLPWRLLVNRAYVGLLLCSLFLGGPWFVAIFQLPQKFQLVHGASGLQAGVKLMPFTFAAPVGSLIASTTAGKFKVPPIFVVLCSAVLQTIGFGLLASLPETSELPARTYGYQIIAGFGCGMNISTLLLIVPFCVDFRDKAVGMGAVSQLRPMGGAVILSIATSVFNSYTRPRLANLLGAAGVDSTSIVSGAAIAELPPALQQTIRGILAHGYNLQMIVLCAFAAAQIPAALLIWKKNQIRV